LQVIKIGQITIPRGPKGPSNDKMRSGGPKLFCSPYFSMAVSLVLLIMTIKYYSLSSQYDDLLLKVSVFQNQLKLTASNMRNLDASLTRKEDSLNECVDEKNTVIERSNNLQRDMDSKIADLEKMKDANDEANNLVRKLKENVDKCSHDNSTMLEELKYLRRRNEELSRNEKECETNKAKIKELEGELNTLKDNENSELQAKDSELQAKDSQLQAKIAEINALQGELNTLKEKSSDLHAQHLKLKNDFDSMKNQPSGQLPDLDPGTVSIRQPALNGTGDSQSTEKAKNVTKERMIENMKRIIENYSEVLKSLQSQLKRFIQLNIDSYNTKLVFENTEPMENLMSTYQKEYGIIQNRTIDLIDLYNNTDLFQSTIPLKSVHIMIQAMYDIISELEKARDSTYKNVFQSINLKAIYETFPGIVGHREPILPRGDPYAEKPKPELHLDAPLHDDNAVREEIIREEEAKEEAKENETVEDENPAPLAQPNPKLNLEKAPEIHDLAEFPVEDQDKPKPIPHESFLAKKAKMEQNPATQSFLDLKLLKRDKDTETEKMEEEDEDETEEETERAVLKLPPNSEDDKEPDDAQEVKNNLPVLADDQIKEYEEDFPSDKEKRDPAMILQDPLARDQDNADLISDSIQNQGHQWRNKLMP